jgi:pimeloyl-ACP methyl ester carboxylesterase
MTMPSLWLFGSADDTTPVEESLAVLDHLKAEGHDITVRVLPDAGHDPANTCLKGDEQGE